MLTSKESPPQLNISEAARRYVQDFGWAILPIVYRGKQPATAHGVKDATRDMTVVNRWFGPTARQTNIGVATGRPSGMWVLDIDGAQGRTSLAELALQHGKLPATRCCLTGGGGLHLYFALPPDRAVACRAIGNRTAIAPGIDVRGDSGYVVIPPSMHPSGKAYAWDEAASGAPRIVAAPQWLVEMVAGRGDTGRGNNGGRRDNGVPAQAAHGRYVQKALDNEVSAVASATPGHRNDTLNKASFALGQLIGSGALDRASTEAALVSAAIGTGLPHAEIMATLTSGITAGMRSPRTGIAPFSRHGTAPMPYTPAPKGEAATETVADAPATAVTPNILLTAELADKGNAECLAHLYGDALRFDHTSNKWRVWSGAHWQIDLDGEAERLATATVRARRDALLAQPEHDVATIRYHLRCLNQAALRALLDSAKVLDQFATTIKQYDTDPLLACAGDITLDLRTCTPRPPQQADYITLKFGAAYDPAAQCPRWRTFMHEVFAGDAAIMAYIQRAVGYTLTGSTREQKCWVCVGNGANGKSLFLSLLHKLLGDYAGSTSWETFDEATNEARGDLAKLRGCRIVTVVESNDDARLNEARIKGITGNDKVTARALYANSFDYVPTYKIWIATNHRPRITGTDNGIWRRIQLVPFTVSFDGARRDMNLEAKLSAELPGILNWALEGLAEWHRQGLNPPAAISAATDEYRADSDVVGQWIEQCCMLGAEYEMTVGSAYAAYRAWCEQSGLRAYSQIVMSRKILERGYVKRRNGRGQAVFSGLGLLVIR